MPELKGTKKMKVVQVHGQTPKQLTNPTTTQKIPHEQTKKKQLSNPTPIPKPAQQSRKKKKPMTPKLSQI